MAKVWIEFEVKDTAEKVGDGKEYFGIAEGYEGPLPDKICIDEARFTRDYEDDSFYVFKFIKVFD
jgi:hypothetical protein